MILHSKIYGQNQVLLILHGLFGMGSNWMTIGKKLAKNYEVHLIDLRNHGKSFHDDKMNYFLMSNDILEYIIHHQIYKPILIGHSMGGKTVMQFALNYPEISQKIIIVDIAPKFYKSNHQEIINIIKAINLDNITSKQDFNIFLKKFIPNLYIRGLLLKNFYKKDNNKYSFQFYLDGIDKNYFTLIQQLELKENKYEKPTLFIRGDQSDYISYKDYPLIKKYFPLSEIVTIKGSSHCVHIDNPIEFYKKIKKFLKF